MITEYQHGNRLITYPSHPLNDGMIKEVLNGETYPLDKLRGYQPTIIVDIGSNVGASLIYFHEHFPQAKIHGFEPSKVNLEFNRKNTVGIPEIEIHPFGLMDQDAELPLFQGLQTGAQHSLYSGVTTSHQTETVQVRDARQVLEGLGLTLICLMKIDTEGSEVAILSRIFSEGSPIAVAHLFVEYHSSEEKIAIDTFLDPIYQKEEISAFEIPCYFPDGRLGSPIQAGVTFYRLRALG
ncbi:MAG: FkbM family methyltransferase [Verrucomicrobiota bacterium]